jgi:hypothetical protein
MIETGTVIEDFKRRTGIAALRLLHKDTFSRTSERPYPLLLLCVKPVGENLGLDVSNGIGSIADTAAVAGLG